MRPRPSRSSVSKSRRPSSRLRRRPAWTLSQTELNRASVKCSSIPPRCDVGNSNPQIAVSVELYPALETPSRFSLPWADARVLFSSGFGRIDLSHFDWRMGMERRRFIVRAGGVLVAAAATAAGDAPSVIAQPKFQWRGSAPGAPPPRGFPGSGPPPGQKPPPEEGGGAQHPGGGGGRAGAGGRPLFPP